MSNLESAIRILQHLSSGPVTLRVSKVSEDLGLPKSTVSRLLRTLNDGGLLERDEESRQYRAGPLGLKLGVMYLQRHSLLGLVDGALERLVERYGFVGYAGVLSGADIVILRQRPGRYPLRYVLEVGSRWAAAETALGLCLIALDDTGDPPGLGSAEREALRGFRRHGRVELPCAGVPGITAVGSAVRPQGEGEPPIGFSISFPDAATDADLRRRLAEDIAAAALDIERLTAETVSAARFTAEAERAAVRA